jgi:hypothetical protein
VAISRQWKSLNSSRRTFAAFSGVFGREFGKAGYFPRCLTTGWCSMKNDLTKPRDGSSNVAARKGGHLTVCVDMVQAWSKCGAWARNRRRERA